MIGSKELGNKIHELREAKKQTDPRFSQRGFAAMLMLSPTFLNKVEAGELVPSARAIKRMAELLETDPDELLACAKRVDPELSNIILEKPRVMAAFLRTASGMSEETLERFRMYMEVEKANAAGSAKKEEN